MATNSLVEIFGREPPGDIRHLIVPVDGSVLAQRALGPALVLANRLNADVTVVTVVEDSDSADAVVESAVATARGYGQVPDSVVLTGTDAALAIVEYLDGRPRSAVCLSSHGRRWPASTFVGSTAASLVAGSDLPVVVIGPGFYEKWELGDRVVACVDGQPGSAATLSAALRWAALLDVDLHVVMVAEPAPPAFLPGHGRIDPDSYLDTVVSASADGPVVLTAEVIWDPVGVDSGVRSWLDDRPTGLLAIASHSRPHRAEEPIGHTGLQIIHDSPIPVLVVPLAAAPEGQRRHPRVTTAPG
jgi:nucleotide-binding universal stress UspA family protein